MPKQFSLKFMSEPLEHGSYAKGLGGTCIRAKYIVLIIANLYIS